MELDSYNGEYVRAHAALRLCPPGNTRAASPCELVLAGQTLYVLANPIDGAQVEHLAIARNAVQTMQRVFFEQRADSLHKESAYSPVRHSLHLIVDLLLSAFTSLDGGSAQSKGGPYLKLVYLDAKGVRRTLLFEGSSRRMGKFIKAFELQQ